MSGLQYAAHSLVGLLTQQPNTTVELEISILMPPGHAHIAARMVSGAGSLGVRLVAYIREAGDTAAQFPNAPLTSLALACTGSSYLVGREKEQRLLAGLSQRYGLPAFTTATAIVECLAQLGARRIALATPYPESLTQACAAYWRSWHYGGAHRPGRDRFHAVPPDLRHAHGRGHGHARCARCVGRCGRRAAAGHWPDAMPAGASRTCS
jgi:hypothetical protein